MQTANRGTRTTLSAIGAGLLLVALAGSATAADQDLVGPGLVESVPMHVRQSAPTSAKKQPVLPSKRFGYDPTRAMVYQMFDPVDEAALRVEDAKNMSAGGAWRVGVVQDFEYPLTEQDAAWQEVPGVGRVWSATILCTDAKAIRAHFSDVDLAPGAELWVYAPESREPAEVFYADSGPKALSALWTKVFPGDTLYVEYFLPTGVRDVGRFSIDQAVHDYRNGFGFVDGEDDGDPTRDCYLDVMCYPTWHPLHNATVKIEYTDGGGSYLCSAAQLNTVAGDETPYIMTAAHCIDNQAAAESITFRWRYQTVECNGGNAVPHSSNRGDYLWSRNSMDASLVMAVGEIPDDAAWAGWETGLVSNGTDIVGIHHPAGDRKKASFGTTIYHPWNDPTDYLGITWTGGTIEGGSSGSPPLSREYAGLHRHLLALGRAPRLHESGRAFRLRALQPHLSLCRGIPARRHRRHLRQLRREQRHLRRSHLHGVRYVQRSCRQEHRRGLV